MCLFFDWFVHLFFVSSTVGVFMSVFVYLCGCFVVCLLRLFVCILVCLFGSMVA